MEERRIVEGCLREDFAARRELYCRFSGRLMTIALRYLGERTAAEDLLHDCFLKIYGSLDKFVWQGEGSLRNWLDRVMVNMALDRLRQKSRQRLLSLDDAPSDRFVAEPAPDREEVEAIPQEVLLQMVAALPEGYRTVFNLYCVEELSHREIAVRLGINEHSSASQLSRARAILAKKIKAYVEEKR